ncbi:SCO1/SenC [Marinibacterium anthonyi]|nr:SCO1/SenC [Marinibacterium anthonyi]
MAATAALLYISLLLRPDAASETERTENDSAFFAEFELTDHRGMVQTQRDFSGRWMLIFFGFTSCPDICPTTLSEVAVLMEGLGDEAEKVQPIFITIDGERDRPVVLSEYVAQFDAGIVGLTGTAAQMAAVSDKFPIFFERNDDPTAPGGYTMSHTSNLFLFDPKAGYSTSWPYGTSAEEILADLQERI